MYDLKQFDYIKRTAIHVLPIDHHGLSHYYDVFGAWRRGSAPVLGTGGRRFKSFRPDHLI